VSVASSRTNGFLFADLRDYTRYVESHGDQAAVALLEAYRTLVRSAVAEFGGAEIKTEGDSFYVVFPSASSAVQCGLAILRAAADRTEADGAPIRVGIGVHAGETVETSEGYVGSAVNVAARVCSQARPGELLVTDTVRALTRTFLPVRFTDRQSRRLKGIPEPVVIYRVEPLAEGEGMAPRAGGLRGRVPSVSGIGRRVRVAVLLTGLLVGGAAAGYLLTAAQRPAGEPSGHASPSPASTATFPTADELDLVNSVPLPIREACSRTAEESQRLGNVASVRCDLDVAAPADTVWYDSFGTQQQLILAFDGFRQRQRTLFGECSPTVSRAHGNWGTGSRLAGSLMCFQADGSTWIIWTYTAERILARAVRAGTAPDDWTDLYLWWDTIKLFQR
jgi:class 3 adenylate cyclase